MCTAMSVGGRFHLFGRTLDLEYSLDERVVITPRGQHLFLGSAGELVSRHAMVGMAHLDGGMPLFYDAVNDTGLAVAALNFGGSAVYQVARGEVGELPSFALIPYVLGQCATLTEARELLSGISVTDEAVDPALLVTPLHWLLADRTGAVVIEPREGGLFVSEAPLGLLTNAPQYEYHMQHLSNFQQLTPEPPQNRLCPDTALPVLSRGMGALGLPGDFTSQSRFVRGAFVKTHTREESERERAISRFFHLLSAVSVPNGCTLTEGGDAVRTVYASCMDTARGLYYFTTYQNRRICAVTLQNAGREMQSYPTDGDEDVLFLN